MDGAPCLVERGLRRVAENRIQEAARQGAFENLPGMGGPLAADRFRDADPAWRLALRVLATSGFPLPALGSQL